MQPQQVEILRALLVEQRVLSLAVVVENHPVIASCPLR